MASYRIQFSRQIVGLEANPGVMNVSVTFLGFLASLSIAVNGSVSQEDLTFRTRRSTMKLDSRYCMIVSGYAPNLFLTVTSEGDMPISKDRLHSFCTKVPDNQSCAKFEVSIGSSLCC
jgi:hypothetical protein